MRKNPDIRSRVSLCTIQRRSEMLVLLCVYLWMLTRALERERLRISNVINERTPDSVLLSVGPN